MSTVDEWRSAIETSAEDIIRTIEQQHSRLKRAINWSNSCVDANDAYETMLKRSSKLRGLQAIVLQVEPQSPLADKLRNYRDKVNLHLRQAYHLLKESGCLEK